MATPPAPQQGNTNLQDTSGDVLNLAPTDAEALAGEVPAVIEVQTGTGVTSVQRAVTIVVDIKAQAVTAGTPVSVRTTTAGKKFRILEYDLSLSVAGEVLIEDGSGTEVLRTPALAAGVGQASGPMGEGILSGTAGNNIYIDVSASGTVNGWIGIEEE